MQIRNILDQGWYGQNPDLGAPFGQNANWFPYTDIAHFAALKLIGIFVTSPFSAGAVYFFLGFPLAALSMYWLLRQFRVGRPGATMAAVLFAVVPGHQIKFGHLWLASYWAVPLGVALILWVATDRPVLRWPADWNFKHPATRSAHLTNLGTLLMVLAVAFSDVYYIAFTLILLAAVLLARIATGSPRRRLLPGALVGASLAFFAVCTLIPAFIRTKDDTVTGGVPATRLFGESEMYAGKLMDLILPWVDHRVDALQFLTFMYNAGTVPTVERPALGFVALAGAAGLLWAAFTPLLAPGHRRPSPLSGTLSALTLLSLALYTKGGMGSFVALFSTPQIRTWSRLYLYVALFGLFAAAIWVTSLMRKHGRGAGWVAAGLLLVLGVMDQTNPAAAPNYAANRQLLHRLSTFTSDMDSRLPDDCAVFQLPIVRFPEEPPTGYMKSNDHLLPYLASQHLRWSYGAMKGTTRADWQLALPVSDTDRLLDDLSAAGFCSVEVDRFGYVDGEEDPSASIRGALGPPIAETSDKRLVAFDLRSRQIALADDIGVEGLMARRARVLRPITVAVAGSLVKIEDGTPYQWVGPNAAITVFNMSDQPVSDVTLTMTLSGPDQSIRKITLVAPTGIRHSVEVSATKFERISVKITAVPGPTKLWLVTGAPLVRVNGNEGPVTAIRVSDLRARSTDARVRIGVLQQLS